MFMSVPAMAADVPPTLGEPGARYWRAMHVFPQLPWYVASFACSVGEHLNRVTVCFSSDLDLVRTLRRSDGDSLMDLVCMLPPWRSASGKWESKGVVAIHRAAGADEGSAHVLEMDDGTFLTGFEGDRVDGSHRGTLVTRIPG